ncbi:PD40 domain-containing protein [bacterium]|nr:PD40 domain-containing protein [bacterium]
MIPRPDLLDARSPAGLEVFQLTDEPTGACHVYMEAQVFTLDSRRLVVHRSAHAHGSDPRDPEHRYLLCDLADGGRLTPLTEELGATGPSVSPDGQWLYYFINQTAVNDGQLLVKRVRLDGTQRETLLVIDAVLPGMTTRISWPYPLSTISSDGRRLATSGFFGDGRTPDAPWGLLVIDLERATAAVVLAGPTYCNLHPQYSRSADAEASHDLLIQENHGNHCDPTGKTTTLVAGAGADVHVIRDDGTAMRDLPWGRDGEEFCQGHQCWRGTSAVALSTAGYPATGADGIHDERLLEGMAGPAQDHRGRAGQGVQRQDLSRSYPGRPRFFHFATDRAGQRLITDGDPDPVRGCRLYTAELGEPLREPARNWTYLVDMRTDWASCHPHPFLSPDGRLGFFNSDESGRRQAYLVRGW